MTTTRPTYVDHTAIRFNQASIIALNILAWLLNAPLLVGFVALVLLVGTLWPPASLFKQIYLRLCKPLGLLRPDPQPDSPQPHLFAQGIGALFLLGASAAFLAGLPLLGWILTAIVVILAAVNLVFGFCLGCFVYYQLARRGISVNLPQWS